MICTFGDLTDVTWWRELDLPTRPILGWDGRLVLTAPDGIDASAEARDRYDELAGKTIKQARTRIVELLVEHDALVGDPRPITHAVKFYEKGDRPLEIMTTASVVPAQRWPRRCVACRAARARDGTQVAPRVHAGALRELGRRAQRRLVGESAAVLRRAVPGVVSARRRRQPVVRRDVGALGRRASRRSAVRSAPGVRREPAGQAERIHGRPRRHGHVGHVVAHAPDRVRLGIRSRPLRPHLSDGRAASGARDHPDVAVLHRGARAPRVRRTARGPTPRSPVGCSTPTARRCRSPRATPSRRWGCSSSTARTRCATGPRAAVPAPTPRSTRGR